MLACTSVQTFATQLNRMDEGDAVNAATFNRSNVARIDLRNTLHTLMFFSTLSALAAVGCHGDQGTTLGGLGMTAGTTGAPTGIAGAAAPIGIAGTIAQPGTAGTSTPTGAAGTAANPPTASTGAAATAGIGAATTAGAGAAAAGTVAAATAGTGTMATAGAGAAAGDATLTAVFAIVQTNCLVCHGMPSKDSTNGNLGMIRDKAQFYAAVVGKPMQGVANKCMDKGMYVVPGNPAMSMLLRKTMEPPPCGAQMAPGNPLSEADTKTLTDWIMAGAPNN